MSTDSAIFGPFDKVKLFGATLVDYSITGQFGDQSTYGNFTLVEDPNDDDYFILQDGEPRYDDGTLIGTPYQFNHGALSFGGLLKSVNQSRGMDGYPIYRVTLVSPVEVLDAVQVILAGYVGSNSDIIFGGATQNVATFQVSNLINAYGWAEGGGQDFGRSQTTDIGMLWTGKYGLYNALTTLTNTPPDVPSPTNFGSYIIYKNVYYKLDLSNLPVPPSYYRLGGAMNMSLMEVMTRFFDDAGIAWMISLNVDENRPAGPHTISFITVPRYVQQPLGKILKYITGQQYINSQSHGQELRSDITQAMLVGGQLSTLQPIQNNGLALNILPFFGFDFNGNPIIGNKPDGSQYADDNLYMNLNATSVADIMGELGYGLSYNCSILEMRCALGNYDTWAAYIQLAKPTLAKQLNLYGSWDLTNAAYAETVIDILNDNAGFTNSLSTMFNGNHWPAICQRLYEFVRSQAEVYYGKKFIVLLPFDIQVYIDPTTAAVTLSNEITDAGYAPEGEQLLGLSLLNENFFLDTTGRFYPFVRYSYYSPFTSVAGQKVVAPNIAYLKGSSSVVQYNSNPTQAYVYSRCEQGEDGPVTQNGVLAGGTQIFYIKNSLGLSVPAMVVTVPDAVWAQADDITGSINDLAYMMNIDPATLANIAAMRSTSFNLQVHPPAFYPNGIAVALKSNQQTYGPWGKFSKHGKLNFEQDDGLVPWDYGGYNFLNQAAIAKLNTIAMGNQVLERGDIIEAGVPKASLGEQLVAEGPILTSIQGSISVSQVTTTYTMETFVNRVGAFTIENAERLRRIGKVYQQLRRNMRQLIVNNIERSNIMAQNYAGFMYGTSYAVEQRTPHAVLGGRLYANLSGTYTPFAWTQTYQESLSNLGLNNAVNFQSTACVGMEALLRPYSTNPLTDSLSVMVQPDSTYNTDNLITGTGLNPIQDGCDINWLLSGDVYNSLKTSNSGAVDYNNARSLAWKGPLMIQAWGVDLQGNPMPNSGALVLTDSGLPPIIDYQTPLTGCIYGYMPDYLKMSNQWPSAPLDLMFDKLRAVWASPGMILHGVNSGTMFGNEDNYMQLYMNQQPINEFIKYQPWLGSVGTGVRMQIGWNPLERAWEVISAQCTS